MKLLKFALAAALGFAICPAATAKPHTLPAFHSEAELTAYLKHLHHAAPAMLAQAPPPAMPAMAVPAPSSGSANESVVVTGQRAAGITNNQESGVDEGDIVKLRGDTLVILRRGRLFTVSLADGGMMPVDSINAYPPGVDARDDWYDEMLLVGDRVIVIGYSYSRGGTEVNRFRLDRAGRLRFEDAYQLRSNDYYSSRNYASRLIGNRLIFYTPRHLPYGDASVALPGLRRWSGQGTAPGFERIGTAREVYLSPGLSDDRITMLHTIVNCDVAAPVLDCKATSVFGPEGNVFYVSSHAVYVWVTPWWERSRTERPDAMLYRLPLDGGAPSAIGARGAPVDQFGFREDAEDGMLNVLVRADGAGDAMWAAEGSQGAVALLRLPLSDFGDGMQEAARERYRGLPTPMADSDFHDRFVGDYVLYGEGNGWGTPQGGHSMLVAAPVKGGRVRTFDLPHPIDRIEVMGPDAVVVGSDERALTFSAVLLGGARPQLDDRYIVPGASQGETRSHGFFYSPNPRSADGRDGVLGLPISLPARPAYRQLFDSSAAMIFLRRADGAFAPLGRLAAHDEGVVDDRCVASCVDWYGNARPIFIGRRTFALMGYELVEGDVRRDAIRETGRIDFSPKAVPTR